MVDRDYAARWTGRSVWRGQQCSEVRYGTRLRDGPGLYKSRPERDIARLLDEAGIAFTYEKPTAVVDDGKVKLWHPDFVLAYGPVIEYFGMVGRQDYDERTRHKLRVYARNGIDVVAVYPQDLAGQWQRRLLGRVESMLEQRLSEYRSRAVRWRICSTGCRDSETGTLVCCLSD